MSRHEKALKFFKAFSWRDMKWRQEKAEYLLDQKDVLSLYFLLTKHLF